MNWRFSSQSRKEEFLKNVLDSQKEWHQKKFEQSLVKLKMAIQLANFIIQNESISVLRDFYIQIIQELVQRYQDRQKRIKEAKTIVGTKSTIVNSKNNANNNNHKSKQIIDQLIVVQQTDLKFKDIPGLQKIKCSLQQAILPASFPQLFTGLRTPVQGILLYGPRGHCATSLAKASANQANGTFFSILSPDLLINKKAGQSEKLIKKLFDLAKKKNFSIIFLDEIDLIFNTSKAIQAEFHFQMRELRSYYKNVLVIGSTNQPWDIDPVLLQIFQRKIYLRIPDMQTRYKMLLNGFSSLQNTFNQEDYQYFVKQTEGFSGRNIQVLIREAAFQSIRKLQNCNKFKKNHRGKLVPCSDYEFGQIVISQNWQKIPKQLLQIPVTADDMRQSIRKIKVRTEGYQKYQQFSRKYDRW